MTFPRYQTREETLAFEVDGDELYGSATFHGDKKALFEGRINGDRLSFITRQFSGSSSQNEVTARYRGKLSGDEIRFVLVLEGSHYPGAPIEFIAVRMLEAK